LIGKGEDTLSNIEQVKIIGGEADNQLNGLAFSLGSVTLIGGDGDDTLAGGRGNDILSGGCGRDTVTLRSRQANVRLTNHQLTGDGIDQLESIEDAVLSGNQADNIIDASRFSGTSYLQGQDGDDVLIPSENQSQLVGGAGADVFILNRRNSGNIKILDFERSEGDVTGIEATILGTDFQ